MSGLRKRSSNSLSLISSDTFDRSKYLLDESKKEKFKWHQKYPAAQLLPQQAKTNHPAFQLWHQK